MLVKKSSFIWLTALYATIALTLPYEWRIGPLAIMTSTSFAAAFVLVVYLLCHRFNKMMLVWVLYNAILLFATYYNGIALDDQISLSIMGIALAGAFELVDKYASKRQYELYVSYFVFLIVINSIQTIVSGGARTVTGDYACIFGDKNWYLYKILPGLFLIISHSIKYKRPILSIKFSIIWILALVSVIIAQSGAGTLVLGVGGLYILLIPYIKRVKQSGEIDNYIVYIALTALIFFMIVIWHATEVFAPIIVGLLGKDLTFTTRTRIWARAIELIKSHLLIGHGALEGSDFTALFYNVPEFTTTHNQYLGELFKGGIPLLLCFLLLIYLALKHIQFSDNVDGKKAMTFGIFCLLLWWMMESITSMYLILVLFICYHSGDGINSIKGEKMNEPNKRIDSYL